LQNKYSFIDYIEGGMDLLDNHDSTKMVNEWKSLEDAISILTEKQRNLRLYEKNSQKKISKAAYIGFIAATSIFLVSTAVSLFFLVYNNHTMIKPQTSIIRAQRAYIDIDYMTVIKELSAISIDKMDVHEKYILAVSYVKGQSVDNFSNDEKAVILSKLSVKGDERLLNYWIYIGRLEIEKAKDIALKLEDSQLLLYSLLQERNQISDNHELTGTEKSGKIKEIDSEIQSIADRLGIAYKKEENQESGQQIEDETDINLLPQSEGTDETEPLQQENSTLLDPVDQESELQTIQ
jgi:type VII secretion protein EssB